MSIKINNLKEGQLIEKWVDYAKERLVGRTIVRVRYLQDEEMADDWWSRALVIELDDGSLLLPSRDNEGNDGGALLGQSGDGKEWTFPTINK